VIVRKAELSFPQNRQTTIAAVLDMATEGGAPIAGELDWRQTGPQTWNVELATETGHAVLSLGGAKLEVDGQVVAEGPDAEYPGLYRAFARLIHDGRSDLDAEPLRLVADAFLLGERRTVDAFDWQAP
jgi:D-galactose 1-dehydrogenase